ncbi:uncharacterized protein LOC120322271 [Drosophila yakuba]|uniref:uncharacterized protein LOC120322271 n=1 Tax=Drosophila yakuba TaxID=7245 RepID=UPI0019307868|nr:uncharacterized protein LOC120322271 [Drosophila yakuba]
MGKEDKVGVSDSVSDVFAGLYARKLDLIERLTQCEKSKHYFAQRLSTLEDVSKRFQPQQISGPALPTATAIFFHATKQPVCRRGRIFCSVSEDCENKFQTSPPRSIRGFNTEVSVAPNIPMPKLPVPRFTGSFTDWPSFFDSFSQLVHENASLSSIRKFYFLKQAFPEGRDQDVSHMALTENGYVVAWDVVVKRCDVPRWAALGSQPDKRLYQRFSSFKTKHCFLRPLVSAPPTHKTPYNYNARKHSMESCVAIPTFLMLEKFLLERLISFDLIQSRSQPISPRHRLHSQGQPADHLTAPLTETTVFM